MVEGRSGEIIAKNTSSSRYVAPGTKPPQYSSSSGVYVKGVLAMKVRGVKGRHQRNNDGQKKSWYRTSRKNSSGNCCDGNKPRRKLEIGVNHRENRFNVVLHVFFSRHYYQWPNETSSSRQLRQS